MDQPVQNDGKEMCNKFHGKGWCMESCQRGHTPRKQPDKRKKWIEFINHCRKNAVAKREEINQMHAKSFKYNKKGQ